MDETELRARIKRVLVSSLGLHGRTPEKIADDASLRDDLNLDSIDALELVLALEQEFAVQVQGKGLTREAFTSVATLARFLRSRLEDERGVGSGQGRGS
jgi:acyl carrier protein